MANRIQLLCAFLIGIIGGLRQMSPSMAFAGNPPVLQILFGEILFSAGEGLPEPDLAFFLGLSSLLASS